MAEARQPEMVKLICGMIAAKVELFGKAIAALSQVFGPVDLVSQDMPFDLTEYYNEQMGGPLLRRFVSFAEPVQPDLLKRAKLKTNEIEADFAENLPPEPIRPARPINLDPGYVASSKLVLASMKDFSHRVYLGCGVYAEVTLMYRKGIWQSLPWTFPDYASGRYDAFLSEARDRLRQVGCKER